MIKNRTAQLMLQTAFCTLGAVAFAASLGLFKAAFQPNFYVWFTNLSNYFCIGVMLAEMVQTARKKEDSYTSAVPMLKFIGLLMILLTFVVYNVMLAKSRSLEENLTVSSIMLHIVLPLMYTADWVLFYERRTVKWTWPLFSAIIPLLYVAFIFIRAFILKEQGDIIYPYFFLDPHSVGTGGVVMWVALLLSAFVVSGYLFMLFDRLVHKKVHS